MPTAEVDAKRAKFRTEVVEPHMVACPVCQHELAWLKEIEQIAAERTEMPDVRPVDEDELSGDEKSAIENSWAEYRNGKYYEFDEMICSCECQVLDQLFEDYFATL